MPLIYTGDRNRFLTLWQPDLKQVPIHPITGRNDTWVLLWSKDQEARGIENIRSGSHAISSIGAAYGDW